MGTWGEGIYDDDEAQDARDAYREILGKGLDGAKATDRFLKEWKSAMKDSDDGPIIWFALADTQWRLGRLEERVRDAAIRIIDSGSSLDRWREAGEKPLAKRQKVLVALKEKLLSPQPSPKKIKVEKPVKPVKAGKELKPSELRAQLRAIHCTVEPKRGGAIRGVSCHSGMTDQLLSSLAGCADSLQNLHVEDCPTLSDVGLQSIGRLRQLKRLALRNLPLTDAHLSHWQDLKQLEQLELHGRGITDAGLACFSACANLKAMELGGTSVGDKTVAWLAQLPALRDLWLRGTKVTDQGLGKLKDHPGIRQFYLAWTAITDRGVDYLARMPNLIWLDIEGTGITDKAIATLFKSNSIRALDVRGTALTDNCLLFLLKMKRLCYLNIEKTKISKAGERQVAEGLPLLGDSDARREMHEAMWK